MYEATSVILSGQNSYFSLSNYLPTSFADYMKNRFILLYVSNEFTSQPNQKLLYLFDKFPITHSTHFKSSKAIKIWKVESGNDWQAIFKVLTNDFGITRLLCGPAPTLLPKLVQVGALDELLVLFLPIIHAGAPSLTIWEENTQTTDLIEMDLSNAPRFTLSKKLRFQTGEIFCHYTRVKKPYS